MQLQETIQRDPMYPYPIPPMVTSCETMVQYHTGILVLIDSRYRTAPSPQGSLLLPFLAFLELIYMSGPEDSKTRRKRPALKDLAFLSPSLCLWNLVM